MTAVMPTLPTDPGPAPPAPSGSWLLFSDIHASGTAVGQVARLAVGHDRLVFAGDICGFGQDWASVIDLFIDLRVEAVLGNHDLMVLDETIDLGRYPPRVVEPIEAARTQLRGRHRDYLASLPWQIEFDEGLFVRHTVGTDQYCRCAEDCDPLIDLTDAPTIVFGHTHRPSHWLRHGRRLINPGSVSHGRGGAPRSYVTIRDSVIEHHVLPEVT